MRENSFLLFDNLLVKDTSFFRRQSLYSRYSTQDWDTSNKTNFSLSDREKTLAERMRADALRTIKSTDTLTRNRQAANTKRLGNVQPWL